MLFEFVQIVYWLALSTWFGSVLFVLVTPPIILKTVKANNPILPHVLSVNLDGQHATLLAGSIVANLLPLLMRTELACAGALGMALIGQWFVIDHRPEALMPPVLRSALFVAATVCVIYDWRIVWPRTFKSRQEYLDNADDPDKANPALDEFDRHQSESMTIIRNVFVLLLGIILFSANISPSTSIDLTRLVK
ncbi:MAG: hypothetical protein JO353_02400 [Phycisphaerae bacterium]|nr:hypothetical protein [Phycisphaerae bacterium]